MKPFLRNSKIVPKLFSSDPLASTWSFLFKKRRKILGTFLWKSRTKYPDLTSRNLVSPPIQISSSLQRHPLPFSMRKWYSSGACSCPIIEIPLYSNARIHPEAFIVIYASTPPPVQLSSEFSRRAQKLTIRCVIDSSASFEHSNSSLVTYACAKILFL